MRQRVLWPFLHIEPTANDTNIESIHISKSLMSISGNAKLQSDTLLKTEVNFQHNLVITGKGR